MCENTILLPILSAVKKIMFIIQIIVPILLIVWATISAIKLLKNPDEKNGTKKILNQFLAAAIIFLLPTIVNAVMGLLGESTDISSCWNNASNYNAENNEFYNINNTKPKKIINDATYEQGIDNNPNSCLQKNNSTNIVFIGNSKTYVHNIPKKVQSIAKSNDYIVNIKSIVEGGYTLNELSSKYSSSINNYYDCAILQEQTDVYMGNYNEYSTGANNVISLLRNANPNIKIYIRALWITNSAGNTSSNTSYQYTENIAAANGATVIYDGKAFDQSRNNYPSINLFEPGDDIHQSEAGAYLSAATIFKTISNSSVQNTTYKADLSEETAKQLLNIADNV